MALLAGVACARLYVGLTEALGAGLVADALRGAPEVALTLLTLRVAEAPVAAVVALPPLHPLLALALTALQAAGHVTIDRPLHHAVTLLAPRDRVIPEGVLLALRARVLHSAGDEGGADRVPSLLVTCGRGRTGALLAVREPEILWLTTLTLLANHMVLAATLT